MMENHLVNKVSRFFPSSFISCKTRTAPDVVESSISVIEKDTKTFHHTIQPPKPFSNVAQNIPSMIKTGHEPKTLFKKNQEVSRSNKKSLFLGSDAEGRKCPPVTPVSGMASEKKEKVKETTKSNVKSSSSNSGRWFSSSDDEEAEFDSKSDAFFSLSSYSSESFRRKRALSTSSSWRRYDNKIFNDLGRCSSALSAYSVNTVLSQCSHERADNQQRSTKNRSKTGNTWQRAPYLDKLAMEDKIPEGREIHDDLTDLYYSRFRRHRRRKSCKSRRKIVKNEKRRKGEMRRAADDHDDFVVDDDNRVEDSYAIEKCSRDPYGDFRTSMAEMIIEKQIFGAKDLEKLLDCFLSLNSSYYHSVIVEVFIEICDTLFGI